MNKTNIETAAKLLLAARAAARQLPGLPAGCVPQDAADAYAIQDTVTATLGPVGGWKVGAAGPDAQPSCAPLPSALMYPAPHFFAAPASGEVGMEAEIALKLKQDLPARGTPYSRDEIIAAIGSIHPAIEIVGYRLTESCRRDPLAALADSLCNSAFVYGPGQAFRSGLDYGRQPVELWFNADKVAAALGGNPAGDIFRLVTWLANHAMQRCGGLQAGQIITTGSCTGMLIAAPGTRVKAVFPGLGDVALTVDTAAQR